MRLMLLSAMFLVAFLASAAPMRAQPLQAEAPSRVQTPPRPVLSLRARILHPVERPERPETPQIRLAIVPVHLALSSKEKEEEDDSDVWSYVAGGVLLVHAVLAAVLMGMDEKKEPSGDGPGFPLPPDRPE